MRSLAWMFAFVAFGAWAEGPSDFSASASVTPANGDALQRFTLPMQAYRDTRRDLADVRVFNANGETVPIALAGDPESVFEPPRVVPLALYAVSRIDPLPGPPPRGREATSPRGREATSPSGRERFTGTSGAEVTVRMSDGTLVEVRRRGGASKRDIVPAAYLLDASQLEEPLAALEFGWNAAPGTEVVPITVEASDDLQSWRLVSRATLWHLTQGAGDVSQARARFVPASKAKYYRVTWSRAPDFALRTVTGEYEGKVRSAPRDVLTVAGRASDKPGEFVFDLGARLPVEAVRVVPAETNSIAIYMLSSRDPPDDTWHGARGGGFYRLVRGGTEIESAPEEIGRRSAREWRVRVDPNTAGIGKTPPKLEVQWRGYQVVYVARGPGPFRLAFGDPDAKPAWVGVSSLIPDYKRGDELKLPEATVGAVEGGPPRRIAFLPARMAELGPRKLALWATLILAVAVLAFMAWRLHRQIRAKP